MNSTLTRLEPLPADRARELASILRQASNDANAAVALDDRGRVRGVTHADDPREAHLLGDLDVHA